MKALLTAALLMLGAMTVPVPTAVADDQPACVEVYGWRFDSAYHSYRAACARADYLEACGYCTSIRSQSGCYYVYYR